MIARCTGMGGVRLDKPGAPAPFGGYLMAFDLELNAFEWTLDKWDALLFSDEPAARAACEGLPQLAVLDIEYEPGPLYRPVRRAHGWAVEDATVGDDYPVPAALELDYQGALELAWKLNRTVIEQGGTRL